MLGALRKSTHFTAFYNADKFVGLLYTVENDRFSDKSTHENDALLQMRFTF